jgi:hypothetical protein
LRRKQVFYKKISLFFTHLPPNENDCYVDFKVYWPGQVEVWFDKMVVDDEIADGLFNENKFQNFDEKIFNMATPENFLYVVDLVKQRKFTDGNIEPINYVLSKMYLKLRNQAIPMTLK